MPKKVNTRDFIDRAHVVHGDKYGYAFSVYQSAHTKVFIHCPEHGMFEQSPNQQGSQRPLMGLVNGACGMTRSETK